jgi:hypothetical protein
MTTVDVINIPTATLQDMSDKIDKAFVNYANAVANTYSYGTSCKNLCKYYRLWLTKRILKDWSQADNGDATGYYNSITETQFVHILTIALDIAKN